MYSVHDYGCMIADRTRTGAYAEALRRAVKPGCVVLDIGTGTAFWAMLACKLGARRVYAIEPEDVIHLARELAECNGCAEQIDFIQELSTRVSLPEAVDVVISDLRGVVPLFQQHIPSIVDARNRLLASSGVLIPQGDTLWAAVVAAPDFYKPLEAPSPEDSYGLNFQPARRFATNMWQKKRFKPEQLLVPPKSWAEINYFTVDNPNIAGEATWTATRAGTGHGLCVWFDAILAPEIGFSNAPGGPEHIYGTAYFPWSQPVALTPGDVISVSLRADLIGADYVWRWATTVRDANPSSGIKADMRQSSFLSAPVSPAGLRKQEASFVPSCSDDGSIDRFILTLMDGKNSVGEIADRLLVQFPAQFGSWRDALTRAGELSQKYSR